MSDTFLSYETLVNYAGLDPFKRAALQFAAEVAGNCDRLGIRLVKWSLGESCALYDNGDHFIGKVVEGLGTKNLVADSMFEIDGRHHYGFMAQDTVAMIVNDLITLGVLPVGVSMHLALEDGSWLKDADRARGLLEGWRDACNLARCSWGGGETPGIKIIINPGKALMSGSGFGKTIGRNIINPANIKTGDVIIFLTSSGIHANGLSLAREIVGKLKYGYTTEVPGGSSYGMELLKPTHIYVPAIEACMLANIRVGATANITGHGWRKLMRANQPFTYVIHKLPPPNPIFPFMQENGPVQSKEMYETFNMGAGFALLMPEGEAHRFLTVAGEADWPFEAFIAGRVEAGPKRVIIDPLGGMELPGGSLAIR